MIVNACIKKYKSDTDLNLFIDYCNGVNTKLISAKPYNSNLVYTKGLYAYYLDSFKHLERTVNSCMDYGGFNNYYIKTKNPGDNRLYLESYTGEDPQYKYFRSLTQTNGLIYYNDKLLNMDLSNSTTGVTLKYLYNLEYINYNNLKTLAGQKFYSCTKLKELYLPNITSITGGTSSSSANISGCKNLDFIYLGPNITDIPRYFLYNSTINDALYIDKPRAEVAQFTGYAYRFSNNKLAASKIICNDDPNWVKPISKNPGIPISHIIQPIYKYNIEQTDAYNNLFKNATITDSNFSKPINLIKYGFVNSYMNMTRTVNLTSPKLIKSNGITASWRLDSVTLNNVEHIETNGIYGNQNNLRTLNLNGLKTYDENAIISNASMIINLQGIVTLDKKLITNSAKKIYLDSVETINGVNASNPVFYNTSNTIYYIGPNIQDMNDYVFSYNQVNTVYVDVPRATLETFSGYAKLFNNGGTNLTVICNDDPDWKSVEELRAED